MSAALRKDMITMATKEKPGFVERCTLYTLVTCEYHFGLKINFQIVLENNSVCR